MAPLRRTAVAALLVVAQALVARGPVRFAGHASRRSTVRSAATLNKVKDAIGTIFVPPPPPLPTTVIEGAALYRFLGVPPDSDFDEIQAAVKALKLKYAGDKKMAIRIDVTKEQISELRLTQRLSGALRVDAAVARKDSVLEKYEAKKKEVAFKKGIPDIVYALPAMWRPIWVPPLEKAEKQWDKGYFKQLKTYVAVLGAIGVLLPGFISIANAAGPLVYAAHLASRGRSPVKRGPTGQVAEVREEKASTIVWSAVLTVGHFLIGRALGQALSPYLLAVRPAQARFLVGVASMTLGACIWQPYSTKSGMKRRSKYKRGGNPE